MALRATVQPVEQAALVEQRGLRGIEELGHILRVEDARPKAGHAPGGIADGEHDAVAEAVVDASPPWRSVTRPAAQQVIRGVALGSEIMEAGIPGIRGITQPEGLDGLGFHAALVKVIQRRADRPGFAAGGDGRK